MDVVEDLEAKRLKPVVRLLGVEDEEGRHARWSTKTTEESGKGTGAHQEDEEGLGRGKTLTTGARSGTRQLMTKTKSGCARGENRAEVDESRCLAGVEAASASCRTHACAVVD
jgi:hypothetical protein